MKKNLSFLNFKILLLFVVYLSTSLFSFAQIQELKTKEYFKINDAKQIHVFENNILKIEMNLSVDLIADKKQYIYVSNEGWCSFENIQNFNSVLNGEAKSFISPLVLYDGYEILGYYKVSYKRIKDEDKNCFVIQWEKEDISFQAHIYENDIKFSYSINKEHFQSYSGYDYYFGIIDNNNVLGYFPELCNVDEYNQDFIFKNNSFAKKNQKENNILYKGGEKLTETFTSSTTWTCPADVTSVTVHCIGGGGAGAGNTSNNFDGCGGGAGGSYARKVVTVVPGNTYTITVGTGGTGSTGNGTDGGASWFSTTGTVYAQGGSGGSGTTRGIGSSASCIGDQVYAGGNGANGTSTLSGGGGGGAGTGGAGGSASGTSGGAGTATGGGDGADGRTTGGVGAIGSTYGGGGSGAFVNNNTNRSGGNGAGGVVSLIYTPVTCTPMSIPYAEGFESISTANTLPNCMAATDLGSDVYTYTANTTYNRIAHSGTDFASFDYGCDDWIFTQPLDLSTGKTYQFSVWYITDGATGFNFEAKFGNAQNSGAMTGTITGATLTSPTNTIYQELTGTFTVSSNGTYYVGLHTTGNFTPWYFTVDDISIIELGPCSEPTCQATGLNLTPSYTSVSGSFTAGACSPSGYLVLRSTSPTFDGWTPTDGVDYTADQNVAGNTFVVQSSNTTSFNETGLAMGTLYYFRIYSYNTGSCSKNYNLTSPLNGSTTTLTCSTLSVPYSENFDAATVPSLPNCWTFEDNGAPFYDWVTRALNYRSTPNCMYISYDASLALDDWAYTPGITLSSTETYELTFYYRAGSSSYTEKLEVFYGNAAASGSMTVELFDNSSFTNTTYTKVTATFTPASSGTYYFGWHAYSAANKSGIYVDDISIVKLSPCSAPTCQATNMNLTTVNEQRIDGTFSAGTCSPSGYLVVYSTSPTIVAGDLPVDGATYIAGNSIGDGTVLQVGTATNFSINTLTRNTHYYFFVFAYNNTSCTGGPVYNTTSPLSGDAWTRPRNPNPFTPATVSATQINVTYTALDAQNVVIVWNTTGVFTTPPDGVAPPAVGNSFSGGTVLSYGTASPQNHTGLIPGTIYYYKAFSYNTTSTLYSTGVTGNATTNCGTISTFPWSQNFDGVTTPTMPNCWTIEDNSAPTDDWMTSTTYPRSTPNCMFISWDGSNALDDWAFSPAFGLTGGVEYELSFYYRAYSTTVESMELFYGNGAISTNMTVELWDNASFNHTTYQLVTVNFTPASSGTYYFGWHAYSAADKYGIHVDDINLKALIECSGSPTAGTISSDISDFCGTGSPTLTATGYEETLGITFQWQSSPDGSAWSNITGANSDTYTASPDITETTYYRLVVTCSNSGLSSNTNTVMVENVSAEITSTNVSYSGACNTTATLTATSDGGTIYWYDSPEGGTELATGSPYTPTITESTTFYVAAGDGGSNGTVGKETSDLSDGYYGGTGTGIVFNALSDFTIVSVKVYVQTAGSDVIINLLNSSGTTLNTQTFTSCPSGLQTLTLNFDVTTGNNYRLVSGNSTNLARDFSDTGWPYTLSGVCSLTSGWLSSTSTTYYFFFDWVVSSGCESSRVPVDVNVTSGVSAPDCATNPEPINGATGVDPSIILSWDPSDLDCQQATSYKLYFGTDNPPTNLINGTDIGNVTSYNPGSLTAPITYYWKVVPTNSIGEATGCPIWNFTTEYTYCTSSATSTSDMDITRVQFGTTDNSSGYNSLTGTQGTASGTAGEYSNWLGSTVPIPIVSQGLTYPISVTIDDGGYEYSHRIDAYIDFNHDGDLVDVGESISIFAYSNPTTPHTATANITIPSDAVTGTTLMRIVCVESTSSSACGTYTWGETEDYTIQIGIPGTNTITTGAGVEPILMPSSIDTQGEAVLNFDFIVTDDGLTPATDGLRTLIKKITFKQGIGNTITDWSTSIAGALLTDGTSTQTADVTITANSIIFDNIPNGVGDIGRINDNASKTYTLKIWLNCPLEDITEGDNFVFLVDYTSILVEPSNSSGFAIGENENSGETNNAIDAIATHLAFIEQPTDVEVNMMMFPKPKLAALDDCGVVDVDYVGTVSLTSTGTMSGAPLSLSLVNGVASFDIIHTATSTNRELTASCGALNVTSDQFDIITKDCQITTTPASTLGEIFVCEGAIIDFEGDYSGPGTVNKWKWRMGNGNEETTQDVMNYEYPTASGYYVELTVEGSFGTCATAVRIMVSPGPIVNNVTPDIESCDGFTYDLSATGAGSAITVTGYEGTGAVALSLADQTYLPDIEDEGEIYSSSLEYTQFDPAATLTNQNFVTIYANIEHSYWGDLTIWLECPNGQEAILTAGYDDSGDGNTYLGEPVDQEVNEGLAGNGMEYRWTMVSPTYPSMDDLADANPYTESYTDNGGTEVTNHKYFPEGSYYPLEAFSNLIGCPLNGIWTIWVRDDLAIDDGYIFEWGLELDESLMPGQWDYTSDIVSYTWTGTGTDPLYSGGPDVTVTPPVYGANTYTVTIEDEYGCTTDQEVIVTLLQCDGVWTGDLSTDWFTDGNWGRGFVPDGSCEGGFGRNVIIPDVSSTSGNFPVITGFANCNDFTVDAGANVQVAPGGALTVCGTMTNNGGNTGVVIKSDATGDGSIITSTAGVTATVERYIAGSRYHYIGTPVVGATTTGIGVSTTDFYQWDATMHWNGMGASPPATIDYLPWGTTYTGALTNAKGYAYHHNTQTLQFVGSMNVGDYSLTLFDESGNTSDADQGWNLVSNPYTSALDWDAVVATGWDNDVESAIYLFDDSDGAGVQTNYRYYVPPSGSGGTYGVGTADASRYIPIGQGFFVKSAKDNQPLAINSTERVHDNQAFYKSNNQERHSNLIRITISSNYGSDEHVIRLLNDATLGYDGLLDARKLIPSDPSIPQIMTITPEGEIISINSIENYTENLVIPVAIGGVAGYYQITANEQNFEATRTVYLKDKQENTLTLLTENAQYQFYHNGGFNTYRFELIFEVNQAPHVNQQIADVETLEDENMYFQLSSETFADVDSEELTYTSSDINGNNLPEWFTFNAENLSFEGFPNNDHVGVYKVLVTATDEFGASASDEFNIEVINVNDAPFVNLPVDDVIINTDQEFTINIDHNTFKDIDINDILTYSASYDGQQLPEWINFNANNLTFTGSTYNITPSNYPLTLKAKDIEGAEASDDFVITINSTTNIEENEGYFTISPNPSSGVFKIYTYDLTYSEYQIVIYDATGKAIYNTDAYANIVDVDISEFASGVYNVKLILEQGTYVQKIIIE